jgi:hypothetical protein
VSLPGSTGRNGIMQVPRSAHVTQPSVTQHGRLGIEYTPENLRCKTLDVFSFISNGTLTANKLRDFIRQSSRKATSNSAS